MNSGDKHGGNIYSYYELTGQIPLDFSSNANPLGIPQGVKKALKNSISQYSAYPDVNCRELKKAISSYEDVDESMLLVGSGAADLIFRICNTVKPKTSLLIAPTFSEYESALINTGCEIEYYNMSSKEKFEIKTDIIGLIDNKDIMFLCNPNNPTGNLVDNTLLLQILMKCQSVNCKLVVDECFMDFVSGSEIYTMKKYLQQFDCLVVLKAFTKIFALAGLRLGYCVSSNNKLLKNVCDSWQPWSVSVPAQIAGVEAVKEKKYLQKTMENTEKERKYLMKIFKKFGMKVFESRANYFLINAENIPCLFDKLYERGILIRKCENFRGLDVNYYRIAVKGHKDNVRLVTEIRKILEVNQIGNS